MHFSTAVTVLSGLAAAQAISFPSGKNTFGALVGRKGGSSGGSGACPAVWADISKDLTANFLANGLCTDLARAAIRYAFHDAGTFSLKLPFFAPAAGGADGSIFLIDSEMQRPENGGLQTYDAFLRNVIVPKYQGKVSVADIVYFAGNHAVITCPGGPQVKTLVGRKDATQVSPTNLMPAGFGAGSDHDTLFALFQDKGFNAVDLAALVGAHSTSTAFVHEPMVPFNGSQDSTPGVWDVLFYSETYNPPPNVFRFDSDIALSDKTKAVGKEFAGFVDNQGKWAGKFADAMFRLSVLGIPSSDVSNFIDCTSALPRGTNKRDMMAASINARAR